MSSRAHRLRIVVLGAGFGGLEVASRLSAEFGDDLDLTLIDRSDGFVFGFSKFDLVFGRADVARIHHPYRDIAKPGVRFLQAAISAIDPVAKRVETDEGPVDADILVVALGADLHPEATPGLVEGADEFYSVEGAEDLGHKLPSFEGGRVVVAVTGTPFKCPPAPSEAVLLMHEHLTKQGLRDRSTISLFMPMGMPIPPSPAASEALLGAFAERGIEWHPEQLVSEIEPARSVAVTSDGNEFPFDMLLAIPVHRVPVVVEEAGMTEDGWIPVDPQTLETRFPDVYALGDVASVGTPKAGVFAEGQGAVVADAIAARIRDEDDADQYGGRGICYVEFGEDRVAEVDVTFLTGQMPSSEFVGPSLAGAADKADFASSRIRRWFDRTWEMPASHP